MSRQKSLKERDAVLSAAAKPDPKRACALQHPARLAEYHKHHAQLRVFRHLPSNFLPDSRDVTVYLPAGYDDELERRYPVLYLHDGQNLFDPESAFVPGNHWRVAETADAAIEAGAVEPLIIVGLHNTGARRLAEYTHSADKKLGGGEADCYGLLLVEEMLPFINETFRTLRGPEHTGIGGSSLGGLVSLYLGLRYPEVFGRLAVMSPSIWWDRRSILKVLTGVGNSELRARIWLDAGDAEGPRTQPDAELLAAQLVRQGWERERDLRYEWIPGGTHDERAWAERVGPMLRWLFPAG
jgi:predicted alpha/beta superfamily hydrolase